MTTTIETGAAPQSDDTTVRLILPAQPPRQSRLSILLRLPIAVPFAAALIVFAALAALTWVAAWVCALVTGRVAPALRRILLSYVVLDARFTAFVYFLVRRPPTPRPPAPGAVRIDVVAPETPLNRWAVLARLVLVVPALIVEAILGTGVAFVWAVMLVCGVCTKKFPEPLTQVAALVTRYRVRTNAYMLLVSAQQPFTGLFGDSTVANGAASGVTSTPLEPDAVASAPAAAPRSWATTALTRKVMAVTLVVGTIGFATLVAFKASETRQPDSASVLHQASYQLINHTDNAITTYSTSQGHCLTARCRSVLALVAAAKIDQQVELFRSRYLFPQTSRAAAKNFASAVKVVANDMRAIASSSSIVTQVHLISVTVLNDLFGALKFEHILLFPSQVHRSSSVTKLEAAIVALTHDYASAVAKFNDHLQSCTTSTCRGQLAFAAANQIYALVTAFEANYTFPASTHRAQGAFDAAVRQVARDLDKVFVTNANDPPAQQTAQFQSSLTHDIAQISATVGTFVNQLNARTSP